MLQQYLPLAVLKLVRFSNSNFLTISLQQYLPLAVLKQNSAFRYRVVSTGLQQYLPLAVLKLRYNCEFVTKYMVLLQQYLPLAVLKLLPAYSIARAI